MGSQGTSELSNNVLEEIDHGTEATTQNLPVEVLQRVISYVPSGPDEGIAYLRLISKHWDIAFTTGAAGRKLVFTYDGSSASCDSMIAYYFGNTPRRPAWANLIIENASIEQLTWIKKANIGHVQILEITKCKVELAKVFEFLKEFASVNSISFTLRGQELAAIHQINTNDFQHLKHLSSIFLVAGADELSAFFSIFNATCESVQNLNITIIGLENSTETTELLSSIRNLLQINRISMKNLNLELRTSVYQLEFDIINKFLVPLHEQKWAEMEFPNLVTARFHHFPPQEIPFESFEQNLCPLIRTLINGKALETLTIGDIWITDFDQLKELCIQINNSVGIDLPTNKLNLKYSINLTNGHENPKISVDAMTITIGPPASQPAEVFQRFTPSDAQHLVILNQSPILSEYSLKVITEKYANLRTLKIEEQVICPARIGDSNLQLIFQHLQNLEKLELSVNMEYLTDSGLTGLSPVTCVKYRSRALEDAVAIAAPDSESRGYSISSLKNLQSLVLKGVGKEVTNLTLLHGIQNMDHLREFTIRGAHKITEAAIIFWKGRAGASSLIKIRI